MLDFYFSILLAQNILTFDIAPLSFFDCKKRIKKYIFILLCSNKPTVIIYINFSYTFMRIMT